MRSTILAIVLAAGAVASGCASNPTLGDQLTADAEARTELADRAVEGEQLVRRGERLVERGQRRVRRGEREVSEGRDLIARGERQIRDVRRETGS